MRKIAFAAPILLLALAACGQGAPSAAQPTASGPTAAPPAATSAPTEAPPATARPTAAPPTDAPAATVAPPTDAPAATVLPPTDAPVVSARPPDELVAAAQQGLARHLGVPADSLVLQSASQMEWSDGGIGCPQPGQLYPQVITPGFLLVFSDSAQAQTYEVHTGRSAQQMVLCENGQPTDLANQASAAPPADAAQTSPATRSLVELARQALAKDLGIDVAAIRLAQIEEVEWRDSSLGCPKPDMNYLQVITPGFRIVLEAQGRSYDYHTDTGKRVVRCDKKTG